MNFLEAVKAIKKGKKLRRPNYMDAVYFEEQGLGIVKVDMKYMKKYYGDLFTADFEATDWEIVGEKKTLSDKTLQEVITAKPLPGNLNVLSFDDVRDAIKEYREEMNLCSNTKSWEEDCAKEIFGEELIK